MKYKILKVSVLLIITVSLFFAGEILIRKVYPLHYSEYILKYSEQYKLDPYLVASVIKAESNFRVKARSHRDAHGLMQITGDTGRWIAEQLKIKGFQVEDLYDPEINIRMGCWYLDNLRLEFKGNLELVLASYNAGRGNVNKWLKSERHSKDGVTLQYIPFKETDKYIKRVKVNYNMYKYIYGDKK
jgi:soluble lytic murein transglycosylase